MNAMASAHGRVSTVFFLPRSNCEYDPACSRAARHGLYIDAYSVISHMNCLVYAARVILMLPAG